MGKLVVIVQCHIVTQRCCGYACMKSFYDRTGKFEGYPEDTRYMTFTCGGCSGAGLAAKLENLLRRVKRAKESKDDVVIHLASCVCSDNYHRPPCPHLDYIKAIIERKGYPLVLGSYISQNTSKKREAGIYKKFE